MTPDLVLFDCDGVLVDSEPTTLTLLLADLAARGLPLTPEASHDLFIGGTIMGAGEKARALGADIPEGWAKDFYDRLFVELAKGVPLTDGLTELLDRLDLRGIASGIVSNGSERKMEITLGPHGLFQRFAGRIFSAHTHGVAKPDPELVLIAARQFGAAPARCVFVDDSPSGCKAGIAAGMLTIGYAEHTDPGRLDGLCTHIARSMAEVGEIIGLTS